MSEIYQGIVVENGINPVRVWLPKKHGYFGTGEYFRSFGPNLFNTLDENKRIEILNNVDYFYQTCPLTSGGETKYDPTTGKATVQEYVQDFSKVSDLRENPNAGDRWSNPIAGMNTSLPQANPAYNFQTLHIMQTPQGFDVPTYDNHTNGNFVKLSIGQRVLCTYIDEGSMGVILCSFPWPSSANQII